MGLEKVRYGSQPFISLLRVRMCTHVSVCVYLCVGVSGESLHLFLGFWRG